MPALASRTRYTGHARGELRDREFTVIAQDPAIRRNGRIVRAQVAVPAEKLDPGPRGYRVSIVDYDSSRDVLYQAVDLGRDPASPDKYREASDEDLLTDPGFHAQNTYALVMRTLARFEAALGRRISWSFKYGHQIQVAPHAFCDANAYYSEEDQGLMFGYFPGEKGNTILSCLSHDVIVHEACHALLDGLRDRYTDPSLPDQAGFHEGIGDVVALLSVFSIREVVEELLRQSIREGRREGMKKLSDRPRRPDLNPVERWLNDSALFQLGEEMGRELHQRQGVGLRNSLQLPANPRVLDRPEYQEAHNRGEILVAAILTGLVRVWARRLKDLNMHGKLRPGAELTDADVRPMAEVGAAAASLLLTMAIRALDYSPPIDLLFGDYLSALVTADSELIPHERKYRFREELLRSFRERGIQPTSEERGTGLWRRPENDPHIRKPQSLRYESTHFESLQRDRDEVFRFLWENRDILGLYPGTYTRVMTVRPCVRVAPDGFVLRETVAEYEQMMETRARDLPRLGLDKPRVPDNVPLRLHGGGTLIFDEFGKLKFNIHKRLISPRQPAKFEYLWKQGYYREGTPLGVSLGAGGFFAELHRRRAVARKGETRAKR